MTAFTDLANVAGEVRNKDQRVKHISQHHTSKTHRKYRHHSPCPLFEPSLSPGEPSDTHTHTHRNTPQVIIYSILYSICSIYSQLYFICIALDRRKSFAVKSFYHNDGRMLSSE